MTEDTKNQINDAFQKFDNGLYSKEQFKSFLYNDLNIKKTPLLDSRLNRTDLKFCDIMKFIDRKEKYHHTNLKPNHMDPTKFHIMASTPSLMSFQNRNLIKNENEITEKYTEKKNLMLSVKNLIEGQMNPYELQSKLNELEIGDEVF